ncbi:hypothetical protein DIZ81_05180 [Legionella taurinensis]|uniref:Uncharacterized protein n=2 Tax=Legionella TaxID=445 RepID=A0A0W0XRN8_9GAMM|nr:MULTISPECIES: hypothetical protein [Legionella]KTD47275.1 hypothetical protein Lrub_2197 [Legionella rubrilucens]MDX1837307.1 hypothetical protein [Legionella taurinensis]PUT40664.1 hypothetical protein DB744_05180 [Legionella taurinensis]PUT44086.1 hypothetical protein DB746_03580 [Legionella taurinensis]PUT47387.1 hypothetical protein DB743_01750 [Legionella taurinensis]
MKKSSKDISKSKVKESLKREDLKNVSGGARLKDILNPPATHEGPLDIDEIERLIRQGIKNR